MCSKTASYILRKLSEVLLSLIFVTIFSFLLMRLSPVDPAQAYVQRNSAIVTQEQIEQVREEMGLNKPLFVQYGEWLRDALDGEFGISLASGYPTIDEVSKALPITLKVVGFTAIISIAASIGLGCLRYFSRGTILGSLIKVLMISGVSIPAFYIAIVFLDFFAVRLGMLSVAGNQGVLRFMPTAICMAVSISCFYGGLLAQSLENEMMKDYIAYARCRGLGESRIILTQALPHCLSGLIPSFMQMMGLCIAGAVTVERVFSLPGIGYLIIDSVLKRDFPMIHLSVLILAFALVFFNVLSDIINQFIHREFKEVKHS